MSLSNEDIVQAIKGYQERLERYVSQNNYEKVLYVISRLKKLPIRTIHLEETGVGRSVNALKKLGEDVGENAKNLVAHWKMMVVEEEQAAQEAANYEDSAVESAPDSSFSDNERNHAHSGELYNSNHHQPSEEEAHEEAEDEEEEEEDNNSSHSINNTNTLNDNENRRNYSKGKHIESKHKSVGEKHRRSEDIKAKNEKDKTSDRHSSKRQRESSSDSEAETKSKYSRSSSSHKEKSHSKRKRDSSDSSADEDDYDNYEKTSKHRRESSSSDSNHKKHKSRSEREEKSTSKSKSKEKSSSDRKHKDERSESKHKSDSKSSSNKKERDERSSKIDQKSEHKKDRHSEKESKSKYESSKSSKSDKDSSKSKSHHERADRDKKEKEKSKKGESSGRHHSSREKEIREKDKEIRDKDKGTRDKEKERIKNEEKSSHSKSKSDKEKSSSKANSSSNSTGHSSSKPDKTEKKDRGIKDKVVTPKNKERIINGIDSESGASFAEALGMCEPTRSSKKKKPVPSTNSVPQKSERSSEKSSSRSSSSKIDEAELSDEKYVPELLREPKLEPINLNIANLLPEITPNYRPIGLPIDQPKRLISEDEALSRVMANKNLRTKVYSGNKTVGKVESLFELCVRVLQDNIDALEYTGGVPFSILKPVLEKATPDQLFNMEHYNPYLMDDTDDLWKLHCQKEFRTKKRQELETWRDMYMRCLDEREARLNFITANIKQSQEKSIPVRTAKLAYVDSVAKPPRNIARKQAKNGIINDQKQSTSAKLSALATAGEAGKVAVPNPGSRAAERSSTNSSSSSSNLKPKKAPLMAKTLSFLKNRFKR